MSPIRLRIDGEHVVFERPVGGGWASDAWEQVARLDRLQAANLCADLEDWLIGGAVARADELAARRAQMTPPV